MAQKIPFRDRRLILRKIPFAEWLDHLSRCFGDDNLFSCREDKISSRINLYERNGIITEKQYFI
jgi:hypothetical protein